MMTLVERTINGEISAFGGPGVHLRSLIVFLNNMPQRCSIFVTLTRH